MNIIGSDVLDRYIELKEIEADQYNKSIEKEKMKRLYFEYI